MEVDIYKVFNVWFEFCVLIPKIQDGMEPSRAHSITS